MFLLDTDALSELEKPGPNAGLLTWLETVEWLELHLSVITIGELWKGIAELPHGPKFRVAAVHAGRLVCLGRVHQAVARLRDQVGPGATRAPQAAIVTPSSAPTPKSWLSMRRPRPHTAGSAIAMPAITRTPVSRITSQRAASRVAPRAMRIPISRVRRVTTNDVTP